MDLYVLNYVLALTELWRRANNYHQFLLFENVVALTIFAYLVHLNFNYCFWYPSTWNRKPYTDESNKTIQFN